MEIKFKKIRIRNFRGLVSFDANLEGRSVRISGANGLGKSSVADAITWVLFGKDSRRRTAFPIDPVDDAGRIIHNLDVSVELEMLIDGQPTTLRRRTAGQQRHCAALLYRQGPHLDDRQLRHPRQHPGREPLGLRRVREYLTDSLPGRYIRPAARPGSASADRPLFPAKPFKKHRNRTVSVLFFARRLRRAARLTSGFAAFIIKLSRKIGQGPPGAAFQPLLS